MGKVLVTGASGRIGIQIVAGLLDKDYEVIGIDYKSNPFNEGNPGYKFIALSPTEKEKFSNVFKNNLIDTVVHAACVADNDIGPVILDEQINESRIWDTFLYKMANLVAVKQFILISTTQIYKNPETREPVREDDDLEPISNYAKLKVAAEDAIALEFKKTKTVSVAAARCAPFYSKEIYENLSSKVVDAKDGSVFLYRTGDYGFHFCNVLNLVDFIICYIRNTEKLPDNERYLHSNYFNVADKELITASQIISFMREFHTLGPVLNRSEPLVKSSKLKLFLKKANEEQITNYRYFDSSIALGNHMYEINKASRICPFRWKISNTK